MSPPLFFQDRPVMDNGETDFREILTTSAGGIIALTGGGGKTSLLFALGEALAATGKKTLCTTTTKMLLPTKRAWLDICLTDNPDELRVSAPRAVYAAEPPGKNDAPDKVRGFAPERIDRMWRSGIADWILVEADGAAGRPLKAPEAHEPVVPAETTIAVSVLGLGCFGKPFSSETAFRLERVAQITGLRPGEVICPESIVPLVFHPEGMFKNTPPTAKRYLFCNQSDLPGAAAAGQELASLLAKTDRLAGVAVASLQKGGLRCLFLPTG